MARFSFFGENYEYKLSFILILEMKSWRKKNRKIEQEEEKKEENKKGAGYCVRKARNNQPSQKV
jgi:hypothetical protein